jgi:hypothetical protein
MYNSNGPDYSVGERKKFLCKFLIGFYRYNRQEIKQSPTHGFELITPNSLSSSISIVNSPDDDFTPLPSPLYSTAIAYSPTTDLI